MARPPSDVNSECGRREGGQLQSTQRSSRPASFRSGAPDFISTQSGGDRDGEGDNTVPSSFKGELSLPPSPSTFATRSPLFNCMRRTSLVSSGYFFVDLESSIATVDADKTTQAPTPSSLVISQAQYQVFQADDMPDAAQMPGDMHAERLIAQELIRIGDEMNLEYMRRARRNPLGFWTTNQRDMNNRHEEQNHWDYWRWIVHICHIIRRILLH
ncbi:bcl-2-like protein 11 [Protopterus annectens]|uniref:bcl-2-like protein 11 n=1 Tax=Protopterus annectens TaxID=7888 RepID=UPI001CFB8DAC|nr:bcl-2-like protein 11 [Protopterus annectens]XP_043913134.1 bcl-2-like protein 11 [Protopterus annectens]